MYYFQAYFFKYATIINPVTKANSLHLHNALFAQFEPETNNDTVISLRLLYQLPS